MASGCVAASADRLCCRKFEDPMIFIFENAKACHDSFSRSERLHMSDRRLMVSSEWRMGTPDGPFAIRYSPACAGDGLGRSAADSPDCPSPAEQVLKNAQNGKGWLLAGVGMDLGSAPRSLWLGAVLLVAVDEAKSPRVGPLCGRSGPSPRRRRALRAKKRYLSTAWALVDRSDSMT